MAAGLDSFGWQNSIAAILIFMGVYIVTQSKSRSDLDRINK